MDVGIGGDPAILLVPDDIENRLHALQVHRQAFGSVGDFGRDRIAGDAAHLLEIGELRHLHPVEPDLPAKPPGAQRRRLPVVLDKPDVVSGEVEPQIFETFEIEILNVVRTRFDEHLKLVVGSQTVRIFPVPAVGRPPARRHVGGCPRLAVEAPQQRRGMEGSRTRRNVVGLDDIAALLRPEGLEFEKKVGEGDHLMSNAFLIFGSSNPHIH